MRQEPETLAEGEGLCKIDLAEKREIAAAIDVVNAIPFVEGEICGRCQHCHDIELCIRELPALIDEGSVSVERQMAVRIELVKLATSVVGDEQVQFSENHIEIAVTPEIISLQHILKHDAKERSEVTDLVGRRERDLESRCLAGPFLDLWESYGMEGDVRGERKVGPAVA